MITFSLERSIESTTSQIKTEMRFIRRFGVGARLPVAVAFVPAPRRSSGLRPLSDDYQHGEARLPLDQSSQVLVTRANQRTPGLLTEYWAFLDLRRPPIIDDTRPRLHGCAGLGL